MEARRGKVKEDKFLVNFKRLLINGQQYFTNAEKFEIKSGNLREAKLFSLLSRSSAKQESIIYQIQKSIQHLPVCADFSEEIFQPSFQQ